jgi:hypothetical protein
MFFVQIFEKSSVSIDFLHDQSQIHQIADTDSAIVLYQTQSASLATKWIVAADL